MSLEEAFLTSLLRIDSLREIFERGVTENVFINPKNKKIYRYILDCYSNYGTAPSPEILRERFEFSPVEIEDSAGNLADYLLERYRQLKLQEILLSSADKLQSNSDSALRYLLEKTMKLSMELSDGRKKYDYVKRSPERIKEYLENKGKQRFLGCPTGWNLYDDWTGGLQKGEIGILFAGTGKGKTYTMLRMAIGAYANGWNPLIISFEPTIKSLYQRLDSIVARVNPRRYRSGELTDEEFQRLEARLKILKKYERPFLIIKPLNNRPSTIVEAIFENRLSPEEDWVVFVDQMSFFSSYGERFEYYRNLFLEISKAISPNNLNIPCWILAQENREGMRSERAQIYNIALSSFAEQFADIVLNLYRENYDSTSAILRILKFREGRPADFAMRFDLDNGIIEVVGLVSV